MRGDELDRIDRRVRAVILDAQCRDWIAERPDRVGFARLGQARHEVHAAARRYSAITPADDWVWPLVSSVTWIVVAAAVLLAAGDPARPLTLAIALVGGMLAGQAAISLLAWVRGRREAPAGPAPIDDPGLYADLTRQIEAAAAQHEAAADDLGRALAWLAAARDEMNTR